jgi:hypothetical protein
MTTELLAIKTAFEDEEMSPEDIAESRGMDLAAIKAGLMQCSSKYRKLCGKEAENEDNLNFTADEQQRIMDVIRDLALGADDESLRFKAAIYIRDDFKGRKDVVKNMNGQQFNILMINEKMKQVRSVTEGIKQKAINV